MKGWSAYDQSADHASKEFGWAEGGDGPVWIGSKKHEGWSERAVQFWNVVEKKLRTDKENIQAIKLDLHFLDLELSEIACESIARTMEGTWHKDCLPARKEVL